MKIIEPSATIIEDELEQLSLYQRIAYCAGVCYQREPRKTEEEAQAFCRKMMSVKHMSTLEMAVVHLAIPYDAAEIYSGEKFLIVTAPWNNPKAVVSGSIRAWLEVEGEYGSHVWNLLADQYPVFFTESDPPKGIGFANPNEIPWQHKHVAVRLIVNRAVSHELVRHRPMSFLQESQRYCRYEDEVVFIRPEWVSEQHIGNQPKADADLWENAMGDCELRYTRLLRNGKTPQQARAVLPNSTKTELIAYASLPQWRHMFNLRCSPAADPEMRKVMIPLRDEFKAKYPEMWEGES